MAQSARLNLRMQKEIKLLLTDPPPGASFPLLSDLSSLSTIHAQIEGPGETVYTEGIFNIRIQVPERYPFQPPIVTFTTPIYHPNIDTGGRICLDILNLPPKGAWQPSLNISTVLTSIGLLLSEPNPDDGLMCEASREYKYNRQAFDQKARSMTEKYAKAGSAGSIHESICSPSTSNSNMMDDKRSDDQIQDKNNDSVSTSKKPYGIIRKLKLGSVIPRTDNVVVSNSHPSQSQWQAEVGGMEKETKYVIDQYDLGANKLPNLKLTLDSSASCRDRESNKDAVLLNHESLNNAIKYGQRTPLSKPSVVLVDSSQGIDGKDEIHEKTLQLRRPRSPFTSLNVADRMRSGTSSAICTMKKKLSLGLRSRSSSQKAENENKENTMPVQSLSSNMQGNNNTNKKTDRISCSYNSSTFTCNSLGLQEQRGFHNKEQHTQNDVKSGSGSLQQGIEESKELIVVDSEDSEEDIKGASRSKLSLARKRIRQRIA